MAIKKGWHDIGKAFCQACWEEGDKKPIDPNEVEPILLTGNDVERYQEIKRGHTKACAFDGYPPDNQCNCGYQEAIYSVKRGGQ